MRGWAQGEERRGGRLLVEEAVGRGLGKVRTVSEGRKAQRPALWHPTSLSRACKAPCSWAPWVGREAAQQALCVVCVDRFLPAGGHRWPALGTPWRVCGGAGAGA